MGSNDPGSVIKAELTDLKRAFDGLNVDAADEKTLKDLKASMDELIEKHTTLISIFEKAEELLEEEKPDPRVDRLLDQNKKLANGILALSNMVKEKFESVDNSLMNMQSEPAYVSDEPPFSPNLEVDKVVETQIDPMPESESQAKQDIPTPGSMDMPGADVPPPPTPPKKGFFRK